jgi:tetratricopeptide (TPR) repeat protein
MSKVLVGTPEDAQANLLMAQLELREGNLEDGAKHLARAVELNPDDEGSLLDLVGLLVAGQRSSEAKEYLEEASRNFPSRGLTAHALARFLAASPDPDLRDGKRALELALKVYSKRRTLQFGETAALAMAESGQCEEAARWQERLISIAIRSGQEEWVTKLNPDLLSYRAGPPCRPAFPER